MSNSIIVEIEDWIAEVKRENPELGSFEKALAEMLNNERKPNQMARFILAGRQMGIALEDLLPTCKALLEEGGAAAWAEKVRRHESEVIKGQETFSVRTAIGPVSNGDGGGSDPWVWHNDAEAARQAKKYIMTMVPTHIRSNLNTIYEHSANGEIKTLLEKLCRVIMKMAEDYPDVEQ
jgi:hypothetical protein